MTKKINWLPISVCAILRLQAADVPSPNVYTSDIEHDVVNNIKNAVATFTKSERPDIIAFDEVEIRKEF